MHSRVLTACRGEKFSAAALNRESRVPRISSLPRPTLAKFRLKRFHIDPSSTRTRDSTDSIQFRGIIRAVIIGDLHTLREGNVRNSLETGFEFEFSEKFRSKFSSEFENFFFLISNNPISTRIKPEDFDPFQRLLFYEIKLPGICISSNISQIQFKNSSNPSPSRDSPTRIDRNDQLDVQRIVAWYSKKKKKKKKKWNEKKNDATNRCKHRRE